ncbi:hypothetical protein [Pseudorhodobacter sp.]|uniref:hypothetical protein n=1 Tax=Pseudorhodobacter sp. TaxID=1934400 RepID=UPI0039E68905
MKFVPLLFTLSVFALPVLAFEIEEIGSLHATFGEESIAQPTVIASQDGEVSPTAYFMLLGGGMSLLNLSGFQRDNSRFDISASFMVEVPGPQTVPMEITLSYSPKGGEYWVSDGAPTPASVTFTTLDFTDKEGRAAGSFVGELCFSPDYGSTVDSNTCRPIKGSFDSRFFVE